LRWWPSGAPMVEDGADAAALALYRCLQRGEHREAIKCAMQLQGSLGERPLLLSKVLAWQAQAHIALGEGAPARKVLREAITLAQAQGDHEGVAALKGLQASMMAQLLANRPPPLDPEQAERPLGRASRAIDAGSHVEALAILAEASLEAKNQGDSRELVLTLLMRARIPGEAKSAIEEAFHVADDSGDFNLVTAVAKAARAAGLPLPELTF
jgi:hypothetical protein